MARDFNGAGDVISFGSDASIDNRTTVTMAFWLQCDDTGINEGLLVKYSAGGLYAFRGNGNDFAFGHSWSGAPGLFWDSATTISGAGSVHIVATYDGTSTTNDGAIAINNVADTITENGGPPSGTIDADAGANLTFGSGAAVGISDFDGRCQNLCFDSKVWTAAQRNQHYWYGRIGGGSIVQHPLITTKLTNEGTATANGTATGTTVASLPRTERMYCASMGCGR